jgi:hypothetical protein
VAVREESLIGIPLFIKQPLQSVPHRHAWLQFASAIVQIPRCMLQWSTTIKNETIATFIPNSFSEVAINIFCKITSKVFPSLIVIFLVKEHELFKTQTGFSFSLSDISWMESYSQRAWCTSVNILTALGLVDWTDSLCCYLNVRWLNLGGQELY